MPILGLEGSQMKSETDNAVLAKICEKRNGALAGQRTSAIKR